MRSSGSAFSWFAARLAFGALLLVPSGAVLADDAIVPAAPIAVDGCSVKAGRGQGGQASNEYMLVVANHGKADATRVIYHITDRFDDFEVVDTQPVTAGVMTTRSFLHVTTTDFTSAFFGDNNLRCQVHLAYFADGSQWPPSLSSSEAADAGDARPAPSGTARQDGDFLSAAAKDSTPPPATATEPPARTLVTPAPPPPAPTLITPAPLPTAAQVTPAPLPSAAPRVTPTPLSSTAPRIPPAPC